MHLEHDATDSHRSTALDVSISAFGSRGLPKQALKHLHKEHTHYHFC
jgi:hypothetical protein